MEYNNIEEYEKSLKDHSEIVECEKIIAEELNYIDVELRDLRLSNYNRKASFKNLDFSEFKNQTILKFGNLELLGTSLEGLYFICTGGTYVLVENPKLQKYFKKGAVENNYNCDIYYTEYLYNKNKKALKYNTIKEAFIDEDCRFIITTTEGISYAIAEATKGVDNIDEILFRKYKFKKPKRKIKVKKDL